MTFLIDTSGPNAGEIEFWNGSQGKNWVKQNDLTDLMYDPFGEMAVECAALKSGDRVIDVGCGCGKTTGLLADVVGPMGHVAGVDVSVPMLRVASRRLSPYAGQVSLICADAASYAFEPESYDLLFSQFGLMFFQNPEDAFSNFYRALKPRGRITFVCWRRPELNPWLMIPFEAVHAFAPEMSVPSPDVPTSPFSLAREDRLQELLGAAGFIDVNLEEFTASTRMGHGDLNECLNFVADFSNPVATALRKTQSEKASSVFEAVRTALAPYHNGHTIELPASSWIVTAVRA
jgi:ubiquinone/menaquinone biosynthesis C-methylase UbiE